MNMQHQETTETIPQLSPDSSPAVFPPLCATPPFPVPTRNGALPQSFSTAVNPRHSYRQGGCRSGPNPRSRSNNAAMNVRAMRSRSRTGRVRPDPAGIRLDTAEAGLRRGSALGARLILALLCVMASIFLGTPEAAAYTITPQTWNTVGLDSNNVNVGPNLFPVGAKVCGGTPGSNVDVYFSWLSSNSYIDLRPGSKGAGGTPLNITFGAGGCADAFFEAQVSRNAAAYDTARQYNIYIGADSTPIPRELYVEHLISQARNAITDVKVNGVSIPAGGSMNLLIGNTYTIDLSE